MLKLELPSNRGFASWNNTLHRQLAESGLFDVSYRKFDIPDLRKQCGRVHKNMSYFVLDGRLCALDTWDTDAPTSSAFEAGCFSNGLLADVDIVLKIQWMPRPIWDKFTSETGKRITPWTCFPSQEFPLSSWDWRKQNHTYQLAVTGANRFGRNEWFEMAQQRDSWYSSHKNDLPFDDFFEICRSCKWGLSLGGKRGTDKKNRREVEFSSVGMPLVLNYKPHYPFPFEAGKQYVYCEHAEDAKMLDTLDAEHYANESRRLWERCFSPRGSAELLVDLVCA